MHASADPIDDEQVAPLARKRWDAIVVGAGPAGSVAARELALAGKKVLLVDKAAFPRRKVCGGCLNAAGIATLKQIGLADLPTRVQALPLEALTLHCGSKSTSVRITGNVAVARDKFDTALAHEATVAGATLITGAEARPDDYDDEGRWVQLSLAGQDIRISAQIVIVAAGLNGWRETEPDYRRVPVTNSRIGAGTVISACPDSIAPGGVSMSVAKGGYVGMVRLANDQLDIAAAFDKKFLTEQGGPAAAAARVLEASQVSLPADLFRAHWFGTPALTHRLRQVASPRLFYIGDAAGYVEPFTGEGMAWAMQSACELAPLALRAIDSYSHSLSAEWDTSHRRLLSRRMLVCGAVGRLLRHPRLARMAVTALARAPWLAQPIVRGINRSRPIIHASADILAPQQAS
jgi:flavin-dependent dehydrogenase